jgi:hypothetical protein
MSRRRRLDLVQAIASLGLPGSRVVPLGAEIEIPEDLDDQVLDLLVRQRVLGVAVSGIEDGSIRASEAFVHALTVRHDEAMAQTMRIEVMGIKVSSQFATAGIEHRFLKGSALAHTVARRPSERSFRDVDLLVESEAIGAAVELLHSFGAERSQPELRPGYDKRFAKSVTMRLDDVEIDLHRLLCPGPFGVWMRPNDLFLVREELRFGQVSLPTLDRTDHLIHACYHVALGQAEPVFANLRDIVLLAGHVGVPEFDAARLAETIERWRGGAVLRRAVRLVSNQFDVELPDALARYLHEPVNAAELAVINPYLTDDPSGRFAALAPATLKALPLGDRTAYAMAVGLPSGSNPLSRVKSMISRQR